jgi:N-acetylneuraminic acid mutarotase
MIRHITITLILFFTTATTAVIAGPWFEKANFGGEARHRSSSFAIGNKGYIGLGHINSGIDVEYEDFWKYDPSSDSWTQIADYPDGRCYHATCFVIGSMGYVGTGRLESGAYSKKFFRYDPITNTWAPIADLPGLERRGAVGFSINGKGYVGTGQTTSGYSTDFYEYNPLNNTWIARAALPGAPRTSSVAFSIGNYGYAGTGNTTMGSSNDFYQFNPATNSWTPKAPVGPTTRQEAVGFAVNGLGYIGTGDDFSSGNNYSDMWEYDPALNSWVQIQDFSGTARRYLTAFVIGSRAYAGTGTNGTNFRDFWMFDQELSVLERKMEAVDILVYPNPSEQFISIQLIDLPEYISVSDIALDIVSINGTLFRLGNLESGQTTFDISGLTSGYYVYQLTYRGDPVKRGKLIKK